MFVHNTMPAPGRVIVDFEDVLAGAGPCTFSARAGEAVALVGLEGGGQSDIGRVLVGDVPLESGRIRLDGGLYDRPSARRAVELGVGFISAKRVEESLAVISRSGEEPIPSIRRSPTEGRAVGSIPSKSDRMLAG